MRKVGLGILRLVSSVFPPRPQTTPRLILTLFLAVAYLQSDPISGDEFVTKWNTAVGDTFISNTSLKLLTVSISIPGFGALYNGHEIGKLPLLTYPFSSSNTFISYFPCAELPTDPAMRFADLFLTRERWKAGYIKPYLSDIAVDTKDLDKLSLKYARALTDKDCSWYTARAR
jgi:sister chromatid cohesion protein DCC1